MTPENLGSISDRRLDSPESPLQLNDEDARLLLQERRTARYDDPIGELHPQFRHVWLAAAAPVGDTGWLAIVQERRDATVQPVDELRRVFTRAGVWSIGIFASLLGLLWFLFRHALR